MYVFAYACEGQKSVSGISLNYASDYTLRQRFPVIQDTA